MFRELFLKRNMMVFAHCDPPRSRCVSSLRALLTPGAFSILPAVKTNG
jgi:hypothetical protein